MKRGACNFFHFFFPLSAKPGVKLLAFISVREPMADFSN
jgi:hypothetical protein